MPSVTSLATAIANTTVAAQVASARIATTSAGAAAKRIQVSAFARVSHELPNCMLPSVLDFQLKNLRAGRTEQVPAQHANPEDSPPGGTEQVPTQYANPENPR